MSVFASVTLAAGMAHADGLAYEFSPGIGNTDNVTRVETDKQDETVAAAQLKFSFDEHSPRVTADLAGNLAYYDYLQNTYPSEVIGNFAGSGTFALVEDHLHAIASDYFGQVLGDPFAPSTPDNRENLNYVTGGLRANFDFGRQWEVDFGGTYSVATYEKALLDSNNLIWDAALTRQMSKASSLGLHLRHANLKYDENVVGATNYDQNESFIRYAADAARTKLSVDLGYTSIDRELIGTDSGLLVRIDAARAISGRSTLTFQAGQEFSNSAAAFASSQSGEVLGLSTQSAQQTGAPFVNRFTTLSWNVIGTRSDFAVIGAWHKQVYNDVTYFDQSFTSLATSIGRDLTPALNVNLNFSYGKGKFELRGGDYSDLLGGMAIRWNVARRIALTFTYDYIKRDSNTTGGDYAENRIWLMLGYQRGAPRSTMRPPEFSEGN